MPGPIGTRVLEPPITVASKPTGGQTEEKVSGQHVLFSFLFFRGLALSSCANAGCGAMHNLIKPLDAPRKRIWAL